MISEGKGRDWLEEWKRATGADNLVLLDYQPYEDLPDVLASADLLIALLEPDASRFSVPSKVLTYLCAERAILGVIPRDNAMADLLVRNGAGVVIDPSARDRAAETVVAMLNDDDRRKALGYAGRSFAEAEFSPDLAAERFESIVLPYLVTDPSRTGAMSGE